MASFYGISSDSVSMLFSSIGKGSSTGNVLADYASIKNGSYYKLAKKYYGGQTPRATTSPDTKKVTKTKYELTHEVGKRATEATTTSTKKVNAKAQQYNEIKSGADGLVAAADRLLTRGNTSVFTENKDKKVDTEEIYKGVSSFVEGYNKTLDNAKNATASSIKTARNTMVNATIANKRKLEEVGISLDKDNKMSIDKDTFVNADINKVKSLFNNRDSYAAGIKTNASYMSMSAKNAANQNSLYARNGLYNSYNQIPAFEDMF
ncbi:hypothetical protein SAMN02910358_00580 [Lachnospiraceae bacterium XBB1006]|nr:hypothetical protein SAMN02910358_00580 [Lachnospiraceae bacterium XBB1006]